MLAHRNQPSSSVHQSDPAPPGPLSARERSFAEVRHRVAAWERVAQRERPSRKDGRARCLRRGTDVDGDQ